MEGRRILVGAVGAPHGVRGEVRIKSHTADPLAIAGHLLFSGEHPGAPALRLAGARLLKDDLLVARIADVTSREAAAALTGTSLFIDRAALPPAEADEFYHADLIGLAVRTTDGADVGRIVALHDHGGGDLLEVSRPGAPSLLVPFLTRFVPVVDVAAGVVLVEPEAVAEEETGEEPAP